MLFPRNIVKQLIDAEMRRVPLSHWRLPMEGAEPAEQLRDITDSNRDFRMWQLKHQRGGDYIIYTNKQSLYLKKPIRVVLP